MLGNSRQRRVSPVLNAADLVKFAKDLPTQDDAKTAVAIVRDMVQRTAPEERDGRTKKPKAEKVSVR